MALFQQGDFTLHSGERSNFKIECDELTVRDLKTIAEQMSLVLPPFHMVRGVPTGGLALAMCLEQYAQPAPKQRGTQTLLLVDDVFTTGSSMQQALRRCNDLMADGANVIGAVIFARCPRENIPEWITPLFVMTVPEGQLNYGRKGTRRGHTAV